MNKKIISIVFFIFIFVFGFLTMANPVRGDEYEFGVPDAAKGMVTEGQIILYDEDEWNNHLGEGANNPDDYFSGDSDVVGAKSKGVVLDWEEGENLIEFFSDFLLITEVTIEGIPEIVDFNSVFDYVTEGIQGLGDPESEQGAIVILHDGITGGTPLDWDNLDLTDPNNLPKSYVAGNGSIAVDTCTEYSMDRIYVNKKYADKLDGVILQREGWDYTDEDFDRKPDLYGSEGEAPFLADPHEWYDSFEKLMALESELYDRCDAVLDAIYAYNESFNYLRENDVDSWDVVNDSIATTLETELGIPRPRQSEGGDNLPELVLDASINPTGENPIQQGSQGIQTVYDLLSEEIPDKFNYLFTILLMGLPTYTPADKYLAEVVDDFDIDGKVKEKDINGLNGDLEVYGDVDLDGSVITLKFEYPENTKDPDNPDKELKNWEAVFEYGDMGTQGSVVFRDEDGEEFYRTGGLGYLPKIDFTIATGISTLFIAGLIYGILIMRKNNPTRYNKFKSMVRLETVIAIILAFLFFHMLLINFIRML